VFEVVDVCDWEVDDCWCDVCVGVGVVDVDIV